jgi:hypothetical protein
VDINLGDIFNTKALKGTWLVSTIALLSLNQLRSLVALKVAVITTPFIYNLTFN